MRRGDGRHLDDRLGLTDGFRLGVGHRHDRRLRRDSRLDHDRGLDRRGLDDDRRRLLRGCRSEEVDARGGELRLVGCGTVHGVVVSRQGLGGRDRIDDHGDDCRRRLGHGLDRHRIGDGRRLGDRLGRRRDGDRLGRRRDGRFGLRLGHRLWHRLAHACPQALGQRRVDERELRADRLGVVVRLVGDRRHNVVIGRRLARLDRGETARRLCR